MTPAARHAARLGLRIATQDPALLLGYLENRLRTGLLPLERRLLDGRSGPPRFVTLKPTLRCNLRCEFCRFVANGDVFGKRDWLDLDDWRRIVDELAAFRPYLCFTGGEPLMVPWLPELIAHARGHGLRCVLTTNGTMLESRAERLVQAPPTLVVLSLDGPREVHDRVRCVAGTYDRALRGARKLAALRQSEGAPYLVVNAAITGHTYESAREMVRVAREFGAAALNFQHFWFLTRPMVERHNARWGDCFPVDFDRVGGTATEGVDPDRLFDTIERLRREDSGLPILFYPELDREQMRRYYAEPEAFVEHHVPSCAWISTDILPDGRVSPCFELDGGSVRDTPFGEIWNGDALQAHRRRLADHGPYAFCARCCAYFRND